MGSPVEPHAPRPAAAAIAPPQPGSLADEPRPADLRGYLHALHQEAWTVAVITLLALCAGGVYLLVAPRIYRAELVIQVDERGRVSAVLPDLTQAGSASTDAEAEILRSRSLLGAVVDARHLQIVATPRYAPLIGQPFARLYRGPGVRAPLMGLDAYAWGGERIRVEAFEIPPRLDGLNFELTAGPAGAYQLSAPGLGVVLTGRVGETASARRDGETFALTVGELTAREGTRFELTHLSRVAAVDALEARLDIAEKGKNTGLLAVTLEGPDPQVVAATLHDLGTRYLQWDVERRSAETEKALAFLDTELPKVRARLDVAESALERQRTAHGVAAGDATTSLLDALARVDDEATTLELQITDLRQKYALDHPQMQAATSKLAQLSALRRSMDARLRQLPQAELESAHLAREVKIASDVYTGLLKRWQELQVVKNGITPKAYLIDDAEPPRSPRRPTPRGTLATAFVLGIMAGVIVAAVRRALIATVDDPEVVERELELPVYAAVPHSPNQEKLPGARGGGRGRRVLADACPDDAAVEALRGLRTIVQFAVSQAANTIVSITGPSPDVGKSFVTVNLGWLLRDAGSRVLVVDADLRKGRLSELLGFTPSTGLSDQLRDEGGDAIRKLADGLDFLPAGSTPPNPSELLSARRFPALMHRLGAGYDVVLVDTPPVLAVSDAVLVGRTAGSNLVVVRAGRQTVGEISMALRRMVLGGVEPDALIVNDLERRAARGSGYAHAYHS